MSVHNKLRRLSDWISGPIEPVQRWYITLSLWLGLTIIGSLVAFLRLPGESRNVLWAEDAQVFVTRALLPDQLGSMFEPSSGYMHAYPRLAAIIATNLAPLAVVPLAMTLFACVLAGAVFALVFIALRGAIPSRLARAIVLAGSLAMPIAGQEVNGSPANSHWFLLPALFIILVTRQRNNVTIVLSAVVTVVAATSDPVTALFLPLLIVRLFDLRSRRALVVPVAYIAGLAVQAFVVLHTSVVPSAGSPSIVGLARATGFRVFLAGLAGRGPAIQAYEHLGLVSLILAIVVVLAVTVWTMRRRGPAAGLVVACIVWAVGVFVFEAYVRWAPVFDPAVGNDWDATRYSILPVFQILVILAAACAALLSTKRPTATRYAGFAALVLLQLFIIVPAFQQTDRHPATTWAATLTEARETCASMPMTAPVSLPTVPQGWAVSTDCATVLKR